MRCFVGIALEPVLREQVVSTARMLNDSDPSWQSEKWVAEENLHVTVRFLGEVEEDALAGLVHAVGCEIDACAPFELRAHRIVARPSGGRCRMLWLGCDDPLGSFRALAAAVARATAIAGAEGDSRVQTPHVTLCRARRPKRFAASALLHVNDVLSGEPIKMSVAAVSLFSSRLAPRGPEYRIVTTWRLRGE